MTTRETIIILERLKEAYEKQKHSDDIVTALAFAIDSVVIVGDIIKQGWGDDNEQSFS